MSSSYAVLLLGALALLLLAGPASPEQISYSYCNSAGKSRCDISNVNISPCPDFVEGEPCKIKRGKQATLTFDFTPHWAPDKGQLKTRAYWSQILDLPFVGMDTDACKYATCPFVKDQPNSYNFTLELAKHYLAQRYDIKFKIWEDADEPTNDCCLVFKLKLI